MVDTREMHLDEMNVPGFIRFSIKAKDTEENRKIHEMFQDFCKTETDDNYTLGLRKLLEFYIQDYKFETLHMMIQDLQEQVNELKNTKEEPKTKEMKVF